MEPKVRGWLSLADEDIPEAISIRLVAFCDISASQRLLPLLQALLDVIQHLDSCFWNPSPWTKHVGNTGFIQEDVVLCREKFKIRSYSCNRKLIID